MLLRATPGAVLAIDRRGQVSLWSPWEVMERDPNRATLAAWTLEFATMGPLLGWWRDRCEPLRWREGCALSDAVCR